MAVYTVSIGDGSTLSSLAVSAGRGPKGDGWTGVSYDPQTGKFTFTSNDGLGYVSDDITVDLDAAVAAAEAAQTAAEAAETNTINLFDQFGDQYLGPKASDPATDNDGDPLTDGDIYFNTTDNVLKFYSGTAWVAPEVIATTAANDAQTAQTAAEAAQSAAETSETNAAASASAASTSETNAAASASAAATSETNAATSETNAANSASAAATSETNAATSETNAAASASAASTSETNAATSETNAANSASAADTSETNAATSETNAANSASAAATSEANAAASFDSFDDRYLGSKSSAPTVDNDGNALLEGALYWNRTAKQLYIWDGSAWATAAFDTANPTFTEVTAAQYNSTEALPDIKPSLNLDFANTKQLDPRITYTRGSTATYYDGKTFAKAEENLLEYSQEFDNAAWAKANATVTANSTAAPDGTTTADTYESLGDGSQLSRSATTSAPFVYSVFAKYVDTQYIRLRASGPDTSTWFDIQNGTIGTNGYSSAAIEDVGNGWYRCSVVEDTTAATNLQLFLHDTNGSLTEVAGSCFLWGAQLEQRSALTDYTATTDQPITNYVPALQTAASGEPRFDHDPITGTSKGFLIEEQRTNLLTYSEQFDNAAWNKSSGVRVTADTTIAPDGQQTADTVENTGGTFQNIRQSFTVTSGSTYVASIFLKAGTAALCRIRVISGATDVNVLSIDPLDGTDESGNQALHVGNGWYRYDLSFVADGTTATVFVYPANTTDTTGSTRFWGAQVEQGSFPTSYIPTVASQVTRSPDAASMTGTNFSSWYRQDEGTVFAQATTNRVYGGTNEFPRIAEINLNTDSNNAIRLMLGVLASETDFRPSVVKNGADQFSINFGESNGLKNAISYKTNDFAAVSNGGTPQSDASGEIPLVNRLNIGNYATSASNGNINGHIKKLAFYPKRLSNDTLQALTEE